MFTLLTALAFFVSSPNLGWAAPIEGAMQAEPVWASKNGPEKVVIALAADLTQAVDPSASPYGYQLKMGIELALSEAENQLLNANIEIEIQDYDSHGENMMVLDVAGRVLESEALAVIGHLFSSEALIAAPVYSQGPMMFVSPGATAQRLQSIGSHVVSTVFTNSEQAKLLVTEAKERKLKTVAIIAAKDCAYCDNLRSHFEKAAKKLKLKVVSVQNILSDDLDLGSKIQLKTLKNVDAIFLPNYEAINAKIIHLLDSKSIKPKFYIGGDGWGLTSDVFRELAEGIDFKAFSMAYWSPGLKEKTAAAFSSRFEAKFNMLPTDSSVLAYDGMNRLIKILLDSDRPLTREGLLQTQDTIKKSRAALGSVMTKGQKISRPYLILEYKGLEVIQTKVKRTQL